MISPPWPQLPPVIPGASAEGPQEARARAAFALALRGQPVLNARLSGRAARTSWWDVRSPQIFAKHPAIRDALASSSIGLEVSYAHLPGRWPVAGWDGESGATAPAGEF